MSAVTDRARLAVSRARTLHVARKTLELQVSKLEKEVEELRQNLAESTKQLDLHSRALVALREVDARLSERGIESVEALLAHGLRTIFFNRLYSVSIEITGKGSRKAAEFWLVEEVDGRVRKNLLRDSAGGVQTVVSLILRVYFIAVTGGRRFLCLDEALMHVSREYVEPLFSFLREIRDELGFDVLYITQSRTMREYADVVYVAKDGTLAQQEAE